LNKKKGLLAELVFLGLEFLWPLSEFLAFRHLFRGASIALMRWEKLVPLISKVDPTYHRTRNEIGAFVRFLEESGPT
jgi:hypothetical protein